MAKNEFIIDLKNVDLTDEQRKSLHNALHDTVAKKIKAAKKANAGAKNLPTAMAAEAAPVAASVTAKLKVTFTKVDPKLSSLTATYNGQPKTINQSDTIFFDNVKSGKRIKIQGNSLGLTTITIDIDADPTQMNFDTGKINGSFFIN